MAIARRLAIATARRRAIATATRRLIGMLARKGYSGGLAAAVVREALDALPEDDEAGWEDDLP